MKLAKEIRDPKVVEAKIKIITPKFFFCRCEKCKMEFRGTPLWKFERFLGKEYVCFDCVNSYEGILEYLFPDKPKKAPPPQRPKGHLITSP